MLHLSSEIQRAKTGPPDERHCLGELSSLFGISDERCNISCKFFQFQNTCIFNTKSVSKKKMTIFNQELATMIANFDETIRPAFNAVVVNSGSYNITVGIRPENGQPGLQFDFKVCYYFFHIHSFIHSFIMLKNKKFKYSKTCIFYA